MSLDNTWSEEAQKPASKSLNRRNMIKVTGASAMVPAISGFAKPSLARESTDDQELGEDFSPNVSISSIDDFDPIEFGVNRRGWLTDGVSGDMSATILRSLSLYHVSDSDDFIDMNFNLSSFGINIGFTDDGNLSSSTSFRSEHEIGVKSNDFNMGAYRVHTSAPRIYTASFSDVVDENLVEDGDVDEYHADDLEQANPDVDPDLRGVVLGGLGLALGAAPFVVPVGVGAAVLLTGTGAVLSLASIGSSLSGTFGEDVQNQYKREYRLHEQGFFWTKSRAAWGHNLNFTIRIPKNTSGFLTFYSHILGSRGTSSIGDWVDNHGDGDEWEIFVPGYSSRHEVENNPPIIHDMPDNSQPPACPPGVPCPIYES